jgi:hypothetical protein
MQAGDSSIGVTTATIKAGDCAPSSVLTSQVENGAVNGEAASTINNQVQARIISGSEVDRDPSKISASPHDLALVAATGVFSKKSVTVRGVSRLQGRVGVQTFMYTYGP